VDGTGSTAGVTVLSSNGTVTSIRVTPVADAADGDTAQVTIEMPAKIETADFTLVTADPAAAVAGAVLTGLKATYDEATGAITVTLPDGTIITGRAVWFFRSFTGARAKVWCHVVHTVASLVSRLFTTGVVSQRFRECGLGFQAWRLSSGNMYSTPTNQSDVIHYEVRATGSQLGARPGMRSATV
jgi:hypothetical protein